MPFFRVKERISASVDKETIKRVRALLRRGTFRNKSHIIEVAIELLAKTGGVK